MRSARLPRLRTPVTLGSTVVELSYQRRAARVLEAHARVEQPQRSGTTHADRTRVERNREIADLGVEGRLSRQGVGHMLRADFQQPWHRNAVFAVDRLELDRNLLGCQGIPYQRAQHGRPAAGISSEDIPERFRLLLAGSLIEIAPTVQFP